MIRLLLFFSRNHFVSFFICLYLPLSFLSLPFSSSVSFFLSPFFLCLFFPLSLSSYVSIFLCLFRSFIVLLSCCIRLNAWWPFVLYQRNNRVSCTQKQIRSPNSASWHVFYVNSIRMQENASECMYSNKYRCWTR